MSEEQLLVERAKTDPLAFGQLYDRYYPKIAGYILRRIGDVAAAQDITSDVFFKAMGSLPGFEWRGFPFSAWLYRIATNEINNYFRGTQRKPLSLEALYEEHHFEMADSTDLERELIGRQDAAAAYQDYHLVRRLLRDLPLKYQEALALRYFEKKSVQEVADITGKKLNTVKSLLARGIERLRKAYLAAQEHPRTQPSGRTGVIRAEE